MRETAKQVWDEAEDGQAFACRFIEDGDGPYCWKSPEVVWIKGSNYEGGVDDLDWESVLWITPITSGDVYYR